MEHSLSLASLEHRYERIARDGRRTGNESKVATSGTALRLQRYHLRPSDVEPLARIGKGAHGEVQVCRQRETGAIYALKYTRKAELHSEKQLKQLYVERDALVAFARARCPWVPQVHSCFQDERRLFLLMEYVPGGDLMGLLQRRGTLLEPEAFFYICELVAAIGAVHALGYVHRDLKPDNLLIDARGHLKLADFSLACAMRKTAGLPATASEMIDARPRPAYLPLLPSSGSEGRRDKAVSVDAGLTLYSSASQPGLWPARQRPPSLMSSLQPMGQAHFRQAPRQGGFGGASFFGLQPRLNVRRVGWLLSRLPSAAALEEEEEQPQQMQPQQPAQPSASLFQAARPFPDAASWLRSERPGQPGPSPLNFHQPLPPVSSARLLAHSLVGTANYVAPEVLLKLGASYECDWWALGVVLFEVLCGFPPFSAPSAHEICERVVMWRQTFAIPEEAALSLSPAAVHLMQQLVRDSASRLGAQGGLEEVQAHVWFLGCDWEGLSSQPAPWLPPLKGPADTSHFQLAAAELGLDADSDDRDPLVPLVSHFAQLKTASYALPQATPALLPALAAGELSAAPSASALSVAALPAVGRGAGSQPPQPGQGSDAVRPQCSPNPLGPLLASPHERARVATGRDRLFVFEWTFNAEPAQHSLRDLVAAGEASAAELRASPPLLDRWQSEHKLLLQSQQQQPSPPLARSPGMERAADRLREEVPIARPSETEVGDGLDSLAREAEISPPLRHKLRASGAVPAAELSLQSAGAGSRLSVGAVGADGSRHTWSEKSGEPLGTLFPMSMDVDQEATHRLPPEPHGQSHNPIALAEVMALDAARRRRRGLLRNTAM